MTPCEHEDFRLTWAMYKCNDQDYRMELTVVCKSCGADFRFSDSEDGMGKFNIYNDNRNMGVKMYPPRTLH